MAVELREGVLWVGGRRVPIVAGEMHYWRLNPARWGEILARYRELGLTMLATYVPWQYHELSPGVFDFEGKTEPQRDLAGFLRAVQEAGLWVFIRPGPYIYSEWTNAGVPDRVVGLCRMSDEYRREAAVWMHAVTEVVSPHFATRSDSGNIVLFQPDNEMDLFSHWFEGPCGLDGTQAGFFQEFLREAYGEGERGGGGGGGGGGGVLRLNEAWGTSYATLAEAQAMAEPTDRFDPRQRTRTRDFWRFQHWAVAKAVKWHADEYRRLGVDLPMVANYYPGGDVQNWRELSRAGGVDILGIDWYPRNEFGLGATGAAGGAQGGGLGGDAREEHRRFMDTCRYQRVVSKVPMIAELECGVWHGYHEYVGSPSPAHYRLMACSAMLAGITSINWYMLVGRDNWYFTPVNERGELRPEVAEAVMGVNRLWGAADPAGLEKLCSAAVVVDAEQIGTDGILADNAALRAFYDAGIDFELFDPEMEPPGGAVRPLMIYGAADWLARASQACLVRYVEEGGTLVVCRQRPLRDRTFHEYNGLGLVEPARVLSRLGKKVRVELPGVGRVSATGSIAEGAVWNWDGESLARDAEAIWCEQVAGTQQAIENADAWMKRYRGKRWICGYVERRGRGRLVVLGVPVNGELVAALHAAAGAPVFARAELPGVQTALFRRGDRLVLVGASLGDGAARIRITLGGVKTPPQVRVTDLWTGRAEEAAVSSLSVRLERRSGGVWAIEPI